jgi:hypothetical protein
MVPTIVLRVARAATALIAIAAIVVQAKTLADAGVLDLVNFLSYFTIQSNIIGIAVLLVMAIRPPGPRPAWLESVRGAATVYLTVTFVVVIFLLRNVDVGLQLAWVDFTLHKLTPLVIVADWLLDPPGVRVSSRTALTWLAFPLVWLAYTMVRGPIAAWYPYPFLDPANGGYGTVAVTVVVILVASSLLCLAYAWLGNQLAARRAPTASTGT